ncbi:hypothetical protein N7456_008487 [Penicillium angulare]|uniref:Arrestin-like N-terminal domain-containing protein n=1 Tax=Penicillium angulare TaxID=116970 RepID=A0A9W9FCU5_9EURO|nr:hypothetical protein N7456_008487 [Penicillium angulare]
MVTLKHVTVQSSPDLKIALNQPNKFIAGQTISGYVLRKSHYADSDACLLVRLRGHTEWVMQIFNGTTSSLTRSCFNFFEDSSESVALHMGPLHIPEENSEWLKWPFSIVLPKNPRQGAFRNVHEKEISYLPLSEASSQQLPPSCVWKNFDTTRHTKGHVEYYLEAGLIGSGKKKGNKTYHASQPLNMQLTTPPIPITDFSTKHPLPFRRKITSQCLIPGITKLSVGQKLQKVLVSSKVPHYTFELHLELANLLQIQNSNTIPLRLWVKPIWNLTSEMVQGVPQMVLVKRFVLNLQTKISYASRRLRGSKERIDQLTHVLMDYSSQAVLKDHVALKAQGERLEEDSPGPDMLIVPVDNEHPPLDLGAALGIHAPRATSGELSLDPTFATFNMKNQHSIEYKLELAIAGETRCFDGSESVLVIGPNCN